MTPAPSPLLKKCPRCGVKKFRAGGFYTCSRGRVSSWCKRCEVRSVVVRQFLRRITAMDDARLKAEVYSLTTRLRLARQELRNRRDDAEDDDPTRPRTDQCKTPAR